VPAEGSASASHWRSDLPVIAALASDPNVMERSGGTFITAETATDYRITDVDGKVVNPSARSGVCLSGNRFRRRSTELAANAPATVWLISRLTNTVVTYSGLRERGTWLSNVTGNMTLW
jgi:hypothetical protein